MAMYQLVIDDARCVECGNCEAILPGVLGAFTSGRLLVSETNLHAHHVEINRAVASCHLEALQLMEAE